MRPEILERLTAAVELARRFPRAEILYAGGSGRLRDALGALGADATEADVARAFLPRRALRLSFRVEKAGAGVLNAR